MFYSCCGDCGERWLIGEAITCKCLDEQLSTMTKEEEMALRELAAKPHYISKVSEVLGPLSLWSKSGMEAEIRKAVEAEREACAKVCEDIGVFHEVSQGATLCFELSTAIRARGGKK